MNQDNSQKAKYAVIFIGVSIFVTIITFFLGWRGYSHLFDAAVGNNSYLEEELNNIFIMFVFALRASQVFRLLAAIFFLIWFYHAYKILRDNNLNGLMTNPSFAVGSFFIPFVNLVFPLLVMSEIHKGTYELTQKYKVDNWKENSVDSKIAWWWFFWVGRIIVLLGGFLYLRTQFFSNLTLVRGLGIFLIYFVFELLAGILLIFVIREINGLQKEIILKDKDEKDILFDSLINEEV